MAFCSSFDNNISSVAIEQSSAEYVLAAGMLVADMLVLADDCTPFKCCIICSLTSIEKIIKIHTKKQKIPKITHVEASTQITQPFAEAENQTLLLFVNVKQEKYDSSSKQVKIIGFSVSNISCFP
jgi:hypothetical protein